MERTGGGGSTTTVLVDSIPEFQHVVLQLSSTQYVADVSENIEPTGDVDEVIVGDDVENTPEEVDTNISISRLGLGDEQQHVREEVDQLQDTFVADESESERQAQLDVMMRLEMEDVQSVIRTPGAVTLTSTGVQQIIDSAETVGDLAVGLADLIQRGGNPNIVSDALAAETIQQRIGDVLRDNALGEEDNDKMIVLIRQVNEFIYDSKEIYPFRSWDNFMLRMDKASEKNKYFAARETWASMKQTPVHKRTANLRIGAWRPWADIFDLLHMQSGNLMRIEIERVGWMTDDGQETISANPNVWTSTERNDSVTSHKAVIDVAISPECKRMESGDAHRAIYDTIKDIVSKRLGAHFMTRRGVFVDLDITRITFCDIKDPKLNERFELFNRFKEIISMIMGMMQTRANESDNDRERRAQLDMIEQLCDGGAERLQQFDDGGDSDDPDLPDDVFNLMVQLSNIVPQLRELETGKLRRWIQDAVLLTGKTGSFPLYYVVMNKDGQEWMDSSLKRQDLTVPRLVVVRPGGKAWRNAPLSADLKGWDHTQTRKIAANIEEIAHQHGLHPCPNESEVLDLNSSSEEEDD